VTCVPQVRANKTDKPVPPRRIGRPTLNDTERKSEMLIDVATDFFVEHGFSGSTIEAIAHAANMGKQAVYTRFTDKESLFNAVIQKLKEQAVFQELPADNSDPIAEGLARRIHAIFADAASPQAMVVTKLATREGHRFPELVPVLVEGTADRYTRPLAAYIEARKRAGEVRDVDAFEAASMCLDLIFSEITQSVFTDTAVPPNRIETGSARIAELLLLGLAVR
jgi:AcrR family transcriptional regulator